MKNKIFMLSIVAACFLAACEKSKDFVEDNTVPTGTGSRPVSSNPFRIAGTTTTLDGAKLASGSTFSTELQFFSESKVKEINFYSTVGAAAKNKETTFPYQPAFSKFKGCDTLLIPYTVPAGLTSNTSIKLEYEIINENTLSLTRTATIKVQ